MATRLYIASDLHAAEKAWRKFVNAIRLNVYKADTALLAGDLTGKAIVPIIERDSRYETELFGVHRTARGDEELAALERDIADVGYYSFITTSEEAGRLSTDEKGRDELLGRLMNERVESWMALATGKLRRQRRAAVSDPGQRRRFRNRRDPQPSRLGAGQRRRQGRRSAGRPAATSLRLVEPHALADPARGVKDDLYTRLDALAKQVSDPRRAVFMIHVPPHDSGLDTAPLLDENLRPTVSAGDVLRGPVGSTAVRRLIENYQPVLSVHGRRIADFRRRTQDR